MRKLAVLLILLLILNFTMASDVQYGKINLTVVNRPPSINSLSILPEQPYYDSVLECKAVIDDETPEKVSLEYKWYSNGVLLEASTGELIGMKDNNLIRCEATPTDTEGEKGETKIAEIKILESPARVKIIKPLMNMAGINVSVQELKEETAMSALTGMVTGRTNYSNIAVLFFLSIFALILIGLNMFGLVIGKRKKPKSPKQDSFLS